MPGTKCSSEQGLARSVKGPQASCQWEFSISGMGLPSTATRKSPQKVWPGCEPGGSSMGTAVKCAPHSRESGVCP